MGKGLLIGMSIGILVVSVGIFGVVLVWHRNPNLLRAQAATPTTTDTSSDSSGSTALGTSDGSSIPLGSSGATEEKGLLSVDASSPSTTQGTFNGQSTSGSGAGASQPKQSSAPGPQSFGAYEQYKDEQHALFGEVLAGTGAEAGKGSKVAVAYSGWLTNGTLFDKSPPDKPFVFQIGAGSVIRGWDEGIFGMKVGGKRRLVVPPAAGYGATGKDKIPGNAVLVFDVELIAAQ